MIGAGNSDKLTNELRHWSFVAREIDAPATTEFRRGRVFPLFPETSLEDSGNYTCEVRGRRSTVLATVTHSVGVRSKFQMKPTELQEQVVVTHT